MGILRLRVCAELIACGLHKKIHKPGNCFLSHHPLTEEILGWICHNVDVLLFYRPFSSSELLPYGTRAWFGYPFHPLRTIGQVSTRCLTSLTAQIRLNVYSVVLCQQLPNVHFTLNGFCIAISMALVGLHLHEKEVTQPCPRSCWKKWLTRQVQLPSRQIFVLIMVRDLP